MHFSPELIDASPLAGLAGICGSSKAKPWMRFLYSQRGGGALGRFGVPISWAHELALRRGLADSNR
jgi:hypothetical protein